MLQTTSTHPTVEEIWEEVKKQYPSVTLASVYRNLHILEYQRKVLSLEVGQGKKRYDGFTHRHAHFFCHRCGEVYDCDIDIGTVLHKVQVSGEVDSFQLTLYGICQRCKKKVT